MPVPDPCARSWHLREHGKYIAWINDGKLAWRITQAGVGPDSISEINGRPVPQEPMVLILGCRTFCSFVSDYPTRTVPTCEPRYVAELWLHRLRTHPVPEQNARGLDQGLPGPEHDKHRLRPARFPDQGVHRQVSIPLPTSSSGYTTGVEVSSLDWDLTSCYRYIRAYTNPDLTTWVDDFKQPIPKSRLLGEC